MKSNFQKYLWLFAVLFLTVSCTRKNEVIITGKINNGSPLERLEIIEASGVATLPLTNIGVDKNGNFSDTLAIEKDGIYVISYAGRMGYLYLKGGDEVKISAEGASFPQEFTVEGDAKANTEYLRQSQKAVNEYLTRLNQDLLKKDEKAFVAELEKYREDIRAKNKEIQKSTKPDSEVVKLNDNELDITMLMISSQYENLHGQMINNPKYKAGKDLTDFRNSLAKEEFVENMPSYRNYLLSSLGVPFQEFAAKQTNKQVSTTEMFAKFLDTQKDFSQKTKDYLLAFVATQFDIQPQNPNASAVMKVLETKVKDEHIKAELKKVETAMYGPKVGTDAGDIALLDQAGKSTALSSLKGKPAMVTFYASWNPYINEAVVPVLQQMVEFYKSKMNFAFVNMDDTQDQFGKTSKALFGKIHGVNLYGKGGLTSDVAKKFGVYGFKLPSIVILDKDGKVASKTFVSIADPELVTALNKISGLNAPVPQPQMPQGMMPPTGAPAPMPEGHSADDGHNH